MNLVCYYSRVSDIIQEREGWADGVYLDLKEAFHKVPHRKLLWKIENTYRKIEGQTLKLDGRFFESG